MNAISIVLFFLSNYLMASIMQSIVALAIAGNNTQNEQGAWQ